MDRGNSGTGASEPGASDGNCDDDEVAVDEDGKMHITSPSTPLTSRPTLPLRKASFGSLTMLREADNIINTILHYSLNSTHGRVGTSISSRGGMIVIPTQQQQQDNANTTCHHHHHQDAYEHRRRRGRVISVPPTEARTAFDIFRTSSTYTDATADSCISQPMLSMGPSAPVFGANIAPSSNAAAGVAGPFPAVGRAVSPSLPSPSTSLFSAMTLPGPGPNSTLSLFSPQLQQQHQVTIVAMTSSTHHPHLNFVCSNDTLNYTILPPTTTDVTSYPIS